MDVEIHGAVAGLGTVLSQTASLDIVFPSAQLDGHAVLGEAEDSIQHDQQDIASIHAGYVALLGKEAAKGGQTVGWNMLQGYTVGHGILLLCGSAPSIAYSFDFCKVFCGNIPVFLLGRVIKLRYHEHGGYPYVKIL
jgi:hypothetical protein